MNEKEAFCFLKSNQPLPEKIDNNSDIYEKFSKVIDFFIENKNEESLNLIFGAINSSDGYGVNYKIEDLAISYAKKIALPVVLKFLKSDNSWQRCWAAQIFINFRDPNALEDLFNIYKLGNFDEKYAALIAMDSLHTAEAYKIIRKINFTEKDKNLIKLFDEILKKW